MAVTDLLPRDILHLEVPIHPYSFFLIPKNFEGMP